MMSPLERGPVDAPGLDRGARVGEGDALAEAAPDEDLPVLEFLEQRERPLGATKPRRHSVEVGDDPLMQPVLRPSPERSQQGERQSIGRRIEFGADPLGRGEEAHVGMRA